MKAKELNIIKFKVRFGDKLLSLNETIDKGYVVIQSSNDSNSDEIKVNHDGVSLLQGTGLKDIDGKEIYEEDILEQQAANKIRIFFRKYKWVYGDVIMPFYVDDGYSMLFNLPPGYGSTRDCHIVKLDKYKIIGNTFENPKLLKY